MTCALVDMKSEPSDRFDNIMNWYKRLSGGFKPAFSNSTYLSERQVSGRPCLFFKNIVMVVKKAVYCYY
jgi:hypothetical protein